MRRKWIDANEVVDTSTIPVYQSEIAPPKIRGFLVLFEGALITLGVMISYWLNYGTSVVLSFLLRQVHVPRQYLGKVSKVVTDLLANQIHNSSFHPKKGFWFVTQHGSFQWRFPIAFQIFFAVLLIIGILLFPESPRWLLKHGKTEEAAEIMGRLENSSADSKQVRHDIREIQKINEMTGGKLTWKEFFSNGREMNGWRAMAAFLSQAFQQIGGINLVGVFFFVPPRSSVCSCMHGELMWRLIGHVLCYYRL